MSTRSPITCYQSGCSHEECRQAMRAYCRDVYRKKAYGTWDPWADWTDAEPVRQHVKFLSAADLGLVRLAEISGVTEGALRALMHGDEKEGIAPTKRIRRDRAEAILAVQPTAETLAAGACMDGTGTRRRLQALTAVGWSTGRLAEILGRDVRVVCRVRTAPSVTARTAREVKAVYDRLWNQAPPMDSKGDRIASARAVGLAARKGWAKPMDWDENIDDPQAAPATGAEWNGIDEVAIERALGGDKTVSLNKEERAEAVRIAGHRLSANDIAKLLGTSSRTIVRDRKGVAA